MKLIVDITEGNWMAIQDGIWCGSEQIAKGIPFEPCEDAVSRQAALDAIKPMPNDNPSYWNNCDVINREDVIDQITGLPSVQPISRWIPVSEKLPEDRRTVLVTAYWHETYQVMEASYYGDGLWWGVPFNNTGKHMQKLEPKAWMPLPSSFEPQESEG